MMLWFLSLPSQVARGGQTYRQLFPGTSDLRSKLHDGGFVRLYAAMTSLNTSLTVFPQQGRLTNPDAFNLDHNKLSEYG